MAEVIVALDLPTAEEALRLVDELPDLRWGKIGPMLFLRSGPRLVHELKDRDVRVFLDLKWHDIPHSVVGAVNGAQELGVDLATVHALGGSEMLSAAVEASGSLKLAAVSVLTSHTPAGYWAAVGRGGSGDLGEEVRRLVRQALVAGVHGVVMSAAEAATLRADVGPDRWIIVPGIRPAGSQSDDQRRTAVPEAAVAAGATHLVVGRPITRAKNPRAVYQRIREAASEP